MRHLTALILGGLALVQTSSSSSSPSTYMPTLATDPNAQLDHIYSFAYNVAMENLGSNCTRDKVRIRREWSAFSTSEKKAYINAVLCLQSKPALTPSSLVPGAKTRYDDFIATHINQTLIIHWTGTFLAWHRWYAWTFEQVLKNECGYPGTLPYWNWPASAGGLEKNPIFDGSDTSLSGNGAYIANKSEIVVKFADFPIIYLPAGTGGGCVTSGPFVNHTINLGPGSLPIPGGTVLAASNPFDYNPRCFKRDLTTEIIRTWANVSSVVDLILQNNDIWDFEMIMQGILSNGSIGVHGGGHYAMGGDPGRDIYGSPGDPAFFLHHGMIDKVWWTWQNLDRDNRLNAISGTGTILNSPPSANTTLDTLIDLGYSAGAPTSRPMKDLMSTTDGMFCYVYE
ncbi:hypothetical protein V8E54_005986 [Elaphomyces granulatus]